MAGQRLTGGRALKWSEYVWCDVETSVSYSFFFRLAGSKEWRRGSKNTRLLLWSTQTKKKTVNNSTNMFMAPQHKGRMFWSGWRCHGLFILRYTEPIHTPVTHLISRKIHRRVGWWVESNKTKPKSRWVYKTGSSADGHVVIWCKATARRRVEGGGVWR